MSQDHERPYAVRVWQAYRELAERYRTPDVPIHAIHGRVRGSIHELHDLLRAESLAHRAVATTGEPALAGDAARQSALTLPGQSETFLNIKLIEPPSMSQPQPPQSAAALAPWLGRRLTRDELDVIIEALEYRCEAIEGGTDLDEVARLKGIGATLTKLRALEAQPQRPEHERYERLLRATAALRYPPEERTAELEAKIEKTITRKVGQFRQEHELREKSKAYERSLWQDVERRHPDLSQEERERYSERIRALFADHRAVLARRQPPTRSQEQGRGIER